jgi:hypothetical protein
MASYPLGSYWTVAAFLVFVFAPILPNLFIQLLAGTTLGNFLLLGLVLAASYVSLGATLSTFLAVAVVYVEYRQRILARVIRVRPDITKAGVDTDLKARDAVEVKTADANEVMFDSVNGKQPLETLAGGATKEAAFYKANGLA